jgi:CRISPR-associated exonuclease Cas4
MSPLLPIALLALGLLALAVGARSLVRGRQEWQLGELAAVDAGRSATLRSGRYRLAGRPDALRRRTDGTLVPVELKRRPAPREGPFASHAVQLAAYCLLVEETTGRSPPFGVLRYADRELVVPWGPRERHRLLSVLAASRAPYDGRADPSPAKCAGCVWSPGCDASLARGGGSRAGSEAAPVDLRTVR